jgi:hypothetical protein
MCYRVLNADLVVVQIHHNGAAVLYYTVFADIFAKLFVVPFFMGVSELSGCALSDVSGEDCHPVGVAKCVELTSMTEAVRIGLLL